MLYIQEMILVDYLYQEKECGKGLAIIGDNVNDSNILLQVYG